MKNIVTVLLLLLFGFVSGQNSSANTEDSPVVVDHSRFFQPAGTQFYNSCQVYSLAYLKSYIWVRKYNLDPKLLKNQFNPWFVWNTNLTPFQHYMVVFGAADFMKKQGCATKDVFTATGEDQELLPSIEEREKALAYKSKRLIVKPTGIRTEESMKQYLKDLKDSLSRGVCFTIGFPLYKSFEMYNGHDSIYSYENNSEIGITGGHMATVVGYNDTIKTKSGRGALKIINSYGPLFGNKGYFYFDYAWFNMLSWGFDCYFLEEDFSSKSNIDLSLRLSQAISGEDIQGGRYPFVDRLTHYNDYPNTFFDYLDFDYHLSNVPLAIVKNVNGRKIDDIIFVNNHNHDGNHIMFADLTSYTKSTDFKSLQVIVQDPISATYIGENNNVLFSYSREAKIGVAESSVRMIGTNKYIVGKVQDLPDTTIVLKNFFSTMISYALTPKRAEVIFINSCTSVLKRKLVTFSISDLQEENVAPTFVNPVSALSTYTNQTLSYIFQAQDKYGREVNFSLLNTLPEASMSSNGELKFKSAKIGTYRFTVVASNSDTFATLAVSVKVDFLDAVEELEVPEGSLKIFPNPLVNESTIMFLLPKEGMVKIEVFNSIGQLVGTVANKIYQAGEQSLEYDASNLKPGVYIFRLSSASFSKSLKIVKQ